MIPIKQKFNGKVVHDVHPSDNGLKGEPFEFWDIIDSPEEEIDGAD
jgi:hypothetical protein